MSPAMIRLCFLHILRKHNPITSGGVHRPGAVGRWTWGAGRPWGEACPPGTAGGLKAFYDVVDAGG
jgi:hypothetical protein